MANRIKGITVEIGGDTTKLSKALEGVNKNIKNTQTQLKDVEKLLKLDPTNTELLSQKHKLLADSVSATKEKLETLKTAAEQANAALANGDISQEQYDALQREIIETEQELQRLQNEAENSRTALVKLGEAGEMLENAGGKVADVGKTLTTHVTVPIVAAGTAAVKTAADFDSAMSKVAAVSGATGDELEALRDKAREMGAKTKFSASEAADAMNYMAMAGWKTQDMISGIDGIMNLAAASGEDLATTSDIVTDALTAFGLSAADSGHFADVLAAASSNANTNVSMMCETFKYCAPVAGALGFSCEDTAQAIGLMANSGIKSTQAGTALRTIMNTLAGEVKICGDAIGTVEIATTNADGSMRELNDILADCRTAFSQLSESEQANAAQALVGKNAMSGFLALMNAAPADIEKLSGAISNCDGTSLQMANTMQDNLSGQLTILMSQLQELAISFGEILMPAIRNVVSKIQELVDKFNALPESTKETIVKVALVAAALGPLLVVLGKTMIGVGKIMQLISNLPAIISGAETAFSAFGGAISGIAGPVLAVVAVIVTLVAAFKHLWDTNEEFRNSMTSIWNEIVAKYQAFFQTITDKINELGFDFESFSDLLKGIWDGLCNYLAPIFETTFQFMSDAISAWMEVIIGIVDVVVGLFTGDWEQVWSGVKGIFCGIWDEIMNKVKFVFSLLCNIFGTDLETVKSFWVDAWTNIKDFFVNIWTNISTFFANIFNAISTFFTTVWTGIKDFFVDIWAAIYTSVSERINLIKTVIEIVWNAIHTAITTVLNAIWTVISTVWNTIYGFISPLLEAFRYLFETIFQAIQIIIGNVHDWISQKISAVWNAIVAFITPILEGIKTFFETVWNAISTTISTVMDTVHNVIMTVWNAVSGFISGILSAISSTVSSIWNAISGYISSVLNTIKSTITNIWNDIKTTISNVLNTIKSTVSNIWDNIKSAISTKISAIKTVITDGFNNAVNFIKNLAGEAWNWGADIINGIVDGIKSCIGKVSDAVTGVADKIRSILHFSVPDEGPLTDFESWMPDFMNGLAKGINKHKSVVEKAVSGVAEAMRLTTNSDLHYTISGVNDAMIGGKSGAAGTVNNYYNNDNSRTVNQTNNSPKALSRLEIYRQTRNAVRE